MDETHKIGLSRISLLRLVIPSINLRGRPWFVERRKKKIVLFLSRSPHGDLRRRNQLNQSPRISFAQVFFRFFNQFCLRFM